MEAVRANPTEEPKARITTEKRTQMRRGGEEGQRDCFGLAGQESREGGRHSIARKEKYLKSFYRSHQILCFAFVLGSLGGGGGSVVVVGSRPRRYPRTNATLLKLTASRRSRPQTERGFCLFPFLAFCRACSIRGPSRNGWILFDRISIFCARRRREKASSAGRSGVGGSNASFLDELRHSNLGPNCHTTNPLTTDGPTPPLTPLSGADHASCGVTGHAPRRRFLAFALPLRPDLPRRSVQNFGSRIFTVGRLGEELVARSTRTGPP